MRGMANGLEYQFFRKIYRQRFGTDLPVWVDNLGLFERTPVVRMAAKSKFRLFPAILIEDELCNQPQAVASHGIQDGDLPQPQKRRLNMSADVVRIAQAFDFACRKHATQRRKGESEEPYVNHLAEVAKLVAESSGGEDVNLVIAALLHDTIEDQKVERQEIAARFGEDVAALVVEVTDDKENKSKAERKRLQVEHAAHISKRAKILKIADKTSNLHSIQFSPPPWPVERKRRYFAWAKAVVDQVRGTNAAVEAAFDKEYEQAIEAGLADRKFIWSSALEVEGDD